MATSTSVDDRVILCASGGLHTKADILHSDVFMGLPFQLKTQGHMLAEGVLRPGGVMDFQSEVDIVVELNGRKCSLTSFERQVQVRLVVFLQLSLFGLALFPATCDLSTYTTLVVGSRPLSPDPTPPTHVQVLLPR